MTLSDAACMCMRMHTNIRSASWQLRIRCRSLAIESACACTASNSCWNLENDGQLQLYMYGIEGHTTKVDLKQKACVRARWLYNVAIHPRRKAGKNELEAPDPSWSPCSSLWPLLMQRSFFGRVLDRCRASCPDGAGRSSGRRGGCGGRGVCGRKRRPRFLPVERGGNEHDHFASELLLRGEIVHVVRRNLYKDKRWGGTDGREEKKRKTQKKEKSDS